jgi:hypothetical protein
MKTSGNRDLFDYWNKRRGHRVAPERGDIEPEAIRHVLGDTFFLAADAAGSYPFRLAGTRLCALFGRELKTESFFSLWTSADQPAIHKLLKVVVEEKIGVIAHATGRPTEGAPCVIDLELLLLPLLQRMPLDARVLGALAPHNLPHWIGARFIGPLVLGAFRHVGTRVEQIPVFRSLAPKAAAVRQNQELRRRFVVFQGGRTD